MQIRLTWEDPVTGERKEPLLTVPIALGREFARLPAEIDGQRVCRMLLNSESVSRYHALITIEQGQLTIFDRDSGNGTIVNGVRQTQCAIAPGDTIEIGNYQIAIVMPGNILPVTSPASQSQIRFNAITNGLDPHLTRSALSQNQPVLPAIFSQAQIAPQDLHATGLPVTEVEYASIGGGLGSLIWVDLLRVGGVSADNIRVLGLDPKPAARYEQLCLNAQIHPHERLRSPSDACPDNLWGFPGYAALEAMEDLAKGRFWSGLGYLWQVFSEPNLATTYTPKSSRVITAIDREAARISWSTMLELANVRSIRQTTDDRYAVIYNPVGSNDLAVKIVRYLHIATGYPALQFLPDLKEYRDRTQDFKTVVNAYEPHEHIYESLMANGGTVLLRGTGIVAARILHKIYTIRRNSKDGKNIQVIQLLRSPKTDGNKYGLAERKVEYNYEFQQFNWPKSCWGGAYKLTLETATPDQRQHLLADWGGVTTMNRDDWQRIITGGISKGWYEIFYGEVQRVAPNLVTHKGTVTTVREPGAKGEIQLESDFIIDATAVDAPIAESPLLADLVKHYQLPLNYLDRLTVSADFEIEAMANKEGKIYAAGAITLGNSYAPVDSFLGLQYAAFASVRNLLAHQDSTQSSQLRPLILSRSLLQWWKWLNNRSPD